MQSDREIAEIVERAVRRSTGIHALRKIRHLVDTVHEEELLKRKALRVIALSTIGGLLVLAVWIFFLRHHSP
jgi:hypothetical protein